MIENCFFDKLSDSKVLKNYNVFILGQMISMGNAVNSLIGKEEIVIQNQSLNPDILLLGIVRQIISQIPEEKLEAVKCGSFLVGIEKAQLREPVRLSDWYEVFPEDPSVISNTWLRFTAKVLSGRKPSWVVTASVWVSPLGKNAEILPFGGLVSHLNFTEGMTF